MGVRPNSASSNAVKELISYTLAVTIIIAVIPAAEATV
jgi:hypothetical protein